MPALKEVLKTGDLYYLNELFKSKELEAKRLDRTADEIQEILEDEDELDELKRNIRYRNNLAFLMNYLYLVHLYHKEEEGAKKVLFSNKIKSKLSELQAVNDT